MRPSVLHVLRPATGGIRRHVDLLLPRLAAAGWDVTAVGPIDEAWAGRLIAAGVGVWPCPLWCVPASRAWLAERTPPAAGPMFPSPLPLPRAPAPPVPARLAVCPSAPGRRHRPPWPDIVHAHGYLAALWACTLPGRHVGTAHNLPRRSIGDPRARWLAVSHAVAAALAGRGVPEERLTVLPGACQPHGSVDRGCCRRALGLPVGRPIVAYVGRIAAGKGIDTLLAAMVRLPWALLVVAGQGLRPPHPSPSVVWLGEVQRPEVVYGAADVVCVPSHGEGFGLAALEALAAGRPVVASATGGLPEIVRHGESGLLVPPGDDCALAMALGALLASPATRRRMGRTGRRVAPAWNLQAQADAVLAVYGELLS